MSDGDDRSSIHVRFTESRLAFRLFWDGERWRYFHEDGEQIIPRESEMGEDDMICIADE